MNILILNNTEMNPQIGGTERITYALAEQLINRGYNIYFIAVKQSDNNNSYKKIGNQIFLNNDNNIMSDENIKQIKNITLDNNIDLIINPVMYSKEIIEFSLNIKRELEIPLVSVLHFSPKFNLRGISSFGFSKIRSDYNIKPMAKLLAYPIRYTKQLIQDKSMYTKVLKESDKLVILSNRFKDEIEFFVGKKYENKVVTIPNFLPFNNTEDVIQEKEKKILFVGRLDLNQKRPDRIISIWEDIFNEYSDWNINILGDGPFKEDLIRYINKKSIKNVELIGFCDPIEYYRKSEIICMTSQYEGLPMVLLEGAAFGCIPVAFNSFKSIYDIIDDEKDGYIVDAYDMNKFKQVLSKLMGNDKLRASIRTNTYKINDKFEMNSIIDKWNYIFYEITNKSRI